MDVTRDLRTILNQYVRPAADELVEPRDGGLVQCHACAQGCVIAPGRSGVCQVRSNQAGVLHVPHGYVEALAVDPIEKKPFYHVTPGGTALSFGMLGCNFRCQFCQNWYTAQALRDERAVARIRPVSARQLVDIALREQCRAIVSTYNEPLITSEWAAEVFDLARTHGLLTGYVSNGFAGERVLRFLRPRTDLYKIDLKAFRDDSYRFLGGRLKPVLETIRLAKEMGFWVEIVTLLVPDFNDSDAELREMAGFLASVSPDMPWHVTAFHPDYKMLDRPRTPAETLRRAYEIGKAAGLRHVYAGNLPGLIDNAESTWCPKCEELLIERMGFHVSANRIAAGGTCPQCGTAIAGVWA